MIIKRNPSLEEVLPLLEENNLPVCDIKKESLVNFFALYEKELLCGIVGLEIYGNNALLRSLCASSKAKGVGSILLSHIEQFCKDNKIDTLYLLTTTAEKYFLKKGFRVSKKETTPQSIQNTQEFSSVCPCDAVCMKKYIV